MLMDSKINLPSSMRSLVLPFFSSAALHNFLMLLRKQHHLGHHPGSCFAFNVLCLPCLPFGSFYACNQNVGSVGSVVFKANTRI